MLSQYKANQKNPFVEEADGRMFVIAVKRVNVVALNTIFVSLFHKHLDESGVLPTSTTHTQS